MFPQKHIEARLFDLPSMRSAIARGSATCPVNTLPLATTGANVGELVGRIIASSVDRDPLPQVSR